MPTILSSLPALLDLNIYGGEPYTLGFQFQHTDETPYPLTGTWKADIRDGSLNAVITSFTVDTTNEAAGLIVLTLSKTNLALIPTNTAVAWDLQQGDAGGNPIRTWYRGAVNVTADVTRT